MISPYRTPPRSNTIHTRKQKNPHTKPDDVKMTSNDLKRTSNKPVKYRKNKLEGGDTKNGNHTQGSFIEQISTLNIA